jgi:hypothetical protein
MTRMPTISAAFTVFVALALTAPCAMAQTTPSPSAPPTAASPGSASTQAAPQLGGKPAQEHIGKRVESTDDKDLGIIEAVIIDPDSKTAAVVQLGSHLGLGDRLVIIPLDELQVAGNGDVQLKQADDAHMKALKEYKAGESRTLARKGADSKVDAPRN